MQIVEKRAASGSFTVMTLSPHRGVGPLANGPCPPVCYHRQSTRMASTRVPDRPSAGRPRMTSPAMPTPAPVPMQTPRQLLLHSWPGRLFIVSTAFKLLVAVLRLAGDLPAFVRVVRSVATIGLAVSVSYFAWRLFIAVKRQLLWRVRRKLVLSYLFFGVLAVVSLAGFFLLAATLVAMSARAYVF